MAVLSKGEANERYPIAWRWPQRDETGWQNKADGDEAESLEVIPLAWQQTRTLWSGEFGSQDGPTCSSDDGILGRIGDPDAAYAAGVSVLLDNADSEGGFLAPECSVCPAASRQEGDRCKISHVLWVLTREHAEVPVRLKFPDYAARGWRAYTKRAGPPFAAPLRILDLSAEWSDRWPKVKVDVLRDLDEEQAAVVSSTRDDHIWGMLALGVNTSTAVPATSERVAFLFDAKPAEEQPPDQAAEHTQQQKVAAP